MLVAIRCVLLGAVLIASLSGCSVSSYGSSSGSSVTAAASATPSGSAAPGSFNADTTPTTGTHNSIVATPQSNLISVQVGQKQTVSVTFTSSDHQAIHGFGLTGTSLPSGWTGPTNFGCAQVDSGSSCVLNLVYAPTNYETGLSVTLNYVYVDNSGTPVTNAQSGASISMSFPYQGTTDDVVSALVTPAGEILASSRSGIATPVTVTFTTSDGHPASALQIVTPAQVADLVPPATAVCATVSAGAPCLLTFGYLPSAPESGMTTYTYTYNDDSGTAKSGSFNVLYQAQDDNAVHYSVSPSPINTAHGASQSVIVTFTTDDGYPASNFSADLSSLAPDWSASAASFNCATLDGGSGCQLTLTYGPSSVGDVGTVQFPFSYTSNAGITHAAQTVNIAYASH